MPGGGNQSRTLSLTARMRSVTMKTILPLMAAIGLAALAGCNNNSNADRDAAKSDTMNSQQTNANPQVDKDPTPDTGTGGPQQGTEPSQSTGQ
jgi:hypothetical protein